MVVGKIKIYKTVIWPVVLYGCETWSLTLREGQAENRNVATVLVLLCVYIIAIKFRTVFLWLPEVR